MTKYVRARFLRRIICIIREWAETFIQRIQLQHFRSNLRDAFQTHRQEGMMCLYIHIQMCAYIFIVLAQLGGILCVLLPSFVPTGDHRSDTPFVLGVSKFSCSFIARQDRISQRSPEPAAAPQVI